ncbi:hypothetical protein BDK51DRAFT_45777, partial [Blyttiomyces helicus]
MPDSSTNAAGAGGGAGAPPQSASSWSAMFRRGTQSPSSTPTLPTTPPSSASPSLLPSPATSPPASSPTSPNPLSPTSPPPTTPSKLRPRLSFQRLSFLSAKFPSLSSPPFPSRATAEKDSADPDSADGAIDLISSYEADSPLGLAEDAVRSVRGGDLNDRQTLLQALFCLADVLRHGPQPDRGNGLAVLPAAPHAAFPREATAVLSLLLQLLNDCRRLPAAPADPDLADTIRDLATLLHMAFTFSRAELMWHAAELCRRTDALAVRLLRIEDALGLADPRAADDEEDPAPRYSGCSNLDIVRLSTLAGSASAADFVDLKGGQQYWAKNPTQLLRLVRVLDIDHARAERIVAVPCATAWAEHRRAVEERETRLASLCLAPHHPELVELWGRFKWSSAVGSRELVEAVVEYVKEKDPEGEPLLRETVEAAIQGAVSRRTGEDGAVFVADLNSLIRGSPVAPLESWLLFCAHRQEAIDLAWLLECRKIQSDIDTITSLPDSNHRQRRKLRDRVALVLAQAASIPSAPSASQTLPPRSRAESALPIATSLMHTEPTGDAKGWQSLYRTLASARDWLQATAEPPPKALRSMWVVLDATAGDEELPLPQVGGALIAALYHSPRVLDLSPAPESPV